MKTRILFSLSALFLLACGGSSSELTITNKFPTESELQELTSRPVETELKVEEGEPSETWELEGPFPTTLGVEERTPTNSLERAAATAIAEASGGVMSEAMHCVARETGRYRASTGDYPFDSLKRYILSRCGSIPAHVGFSGTTWPQKVSIEDIAMRSDTLNELEATVSKVAARAENPSVGVWLGHSESGETLLLVAYGTRKVELESVPMVATDDSVVIAGEILEDDIDFMYAASTLGDFGYEECENDSRVSLPRFRVTCRLDPSDSHAYIGLNGSKTGLSFTTNYGVLMAWAGPSPDTTYRSPATRRAIRAHREKLATRDSPAVPGSIEAPSDAPTDGNESPSHARAGELEDEVEQPEAVPDDATVEAGESAEMPGADDEADVEPSPLAPGVGEVEVRDYASAATQVVNAVRRQAGLAPLLLDARQSEDNSQMTPHYLEAVENNDNATVEKIIRGASAGWKVQGNIVSARVLASSASGTDPSRMLEAQLETASGREVYLRPEAESIALGVAPITGGVGVLTSTYDFMQDSNFKARWEALLADINRQRRQRGLPDAKISKKAIATARRVSAEMEAGQTTFGSAFDQVLEQVSIKYNEKTKGWYLYRDRLENIEWPDEVLNAQSMRVSIAVAPVKPDGYPWTVYAIALAFPER